MDTEDESRVNERTADAEEEDSDAALLSERTAHVVEPMEVEEEMPVPSSWRNAFGLITYFKK